jgi:uncharacterized peroxidase-related enzyme
MTESMSWFPVPDPQELPEDLQKLFAKAQERLGFVPNVFRAYSFRPERLRAWFTHFRLLHEPTDGLSAAEREMIAVAVSMANGCLYCLVAHGAALREALADPVLADRITLDYRRAGLDERRTAILDFAVKVTRSPLDCNPAELAHLRSFASSRRHPRHRPAHQANDSSAPAGTRASSPPRPCSPIAAAPPGTPTHTTPGVPSDRSVTGSTAPPVSLRM